MAFNELTLWSVDNAGALIVIAGLLTEFIADMNYFNRPDREKLKKRISHSGVLIIVLGVALEIRESGKQSAKLTNATRQAGEAKERAANLERENIELRYSNLPRHLWSAEESSRRLSKISGINVLLIESINDRETAGEFNVEIKEMFNWAKWKWRYVAVTNRLGLTIGMHLLPNAKPEEAENVRRATLTLVNEMFDNGVVVLPDPILDLPKIVNTNCIVIQIGRRLNAKREIRLFWHWRTNGIEYAEWKN